MVTLSTIRLKDFVSFFQKKEVVLHFAYILYIIHDTLKETVFEYFEITKTVYREA